MAEVGVEVEVVGFGFEEGMTSWLPAHVLHEACGMGTHYFSSKEKLGQRAALNQRNHHQRFKLTGEQLPQPQVKSTLARSKPSHRSRYNHNHNHNRASGGPGMQAIFLESGQKSCGGTGVFLPRRAGSDSSRPKPACSPVLLPSRVVQALNLNVHALGLHISPQRADPKTKQRVGSETNNRHDNNKKKSNENVTMTDQSGSSNYISRTQSNNSTDIFLPKEWSY